MNSPIVELTAIQDVFVSGVCNVDLIGREVYRITYYSDGTCTYDGRRERSVVAKIIVTRDTLHEIREFVGRSLERRQIYPANH